MMFKLSIACYAIRYVKHFMSQDTLRTIYFSYFHSILSYSIICWGNSAYSSDIFKIKKKKDNQSNYECQKQRFLLSIIQEYKNFTIKIKIYFFPFSYLLPKIEIYMNQIHNINTRFSSDLHTPAANLTTFQKGPFYFGIKIFNHLPTSIKKYIS